MSFTKYFKRKDYDNLDRFLLQQKFRSCRDPFEGDPFKIQSLNFRYADKPRFYPINDYSQAFRMAEKPQMQTLKNQFEKENKSFDNSKQNPLMKTARKSSSIYAFSSVLKPENFASNSIPHSSIESFQRGTNSTSAKKIDLNRSRSFVRHPMSVPFTEEGAFSSHQSVPKNNILKPKNNTESKKRSGSMSTINVDHSGGCEITIKINGVPSNKVHINEKVKSCESSQNRTKSISKPKIQSPYELKPSRSYVIHRNDTSGDISPEPRKSSRKILRECSTHSMIPHKEEKCTVKELRKSSSIVNTSIVPSSSSKPKYSSPESSQLNVSRKVSHNIRLENLPEKNLRQASILKKILSNNPIIVPSTKSFLLTKSKSVLDQRFTPLPMSGKYTLENNSSKRPSSL